MRTAARSPLWHDGDFLRFWGAASLSLTGDAVTMLALPLIAIAMLEATPFQVGLLGGAQFLPFLLVGLPAGAIVDRIARQRLLLVSADIARGLCLLSVPLAYATGDLSFTQLYAVAFVNGVLTVFFDVTANAYLPTLVGRDDLVDGNSKLELSRSGSQIAGPGLAGLVIELVSAPFALAADALSFLASGALLAGIRGSSAPVHNGAERGVADLPREIVEGTRFVLHHPHLRAIALTTTAANFFRSALLAVLLVYLVRVAGASAGAIGVAFTVGNVGIVAAALIAPSVSRRYGLGRTMRVAVSLFGPAALLVAVAPSRLAIPATACMILVDGFGMGLHGVNQVSLRQAATPERLRGRMTATLRFLNFGMMPFGTILGGALATLVGLRPAIWICALGLFLPALPYALSSTGRLVRLPDHASTTVAPRRKYA